MMHRKRKKKKGAMQKFLEKNQVFKSMKKPMTAPTASGGGLLRQNLKIGPAVLSEVANPQVGGAIRNQAGTVPPRGNPLEPRPVPGLRREMEKVNRRVRQRFGAK
jgi:hypothetical protein